MLYSLRNLKRRADISQTNAAVQTDASGQVTAVDGQSTVEYKAWKLYMVSPGDGTIGISWLIFGIFVGSLVLLGIIVPLAFCLCCGDKCCTCCGSAGGAAEGGKASAAVKDTGKYSW